jgi:transposase InsO family protein
MPPCESSHRSRSRILNDGKRHSPRAGGQHVHVAIDDHSRYLITEIYPAENADSCVRHLRKAVTELTERGIQVERGMTDNGSGYRSKRFKQATHDLGLPGWARWYNNHRPHGSLNAQPPVPRVSQEARQNS